MPTLPTLPVELQRLVTEKYNFSCLHALIFTCKAIWPVVTEYPYRKIVWEEGETGWTCRNIQLLLRTFNEDPQIALMVDTLDLGSRDGHYGFTNRYEYPNDVGRADIDMAIYEQAMVSLRTMEIPDPESWSDDFKLGSLDPWIASLISRCRHFQSSTLSPPLVHRSRYLGIILMHLVRPHSRHFDRLRHVELGKDGEALDLVGLHISKWIIVPLLFLPAFDHLGLILSMTSEKTRNAAQNPSSVAIRLNPSDLLATSLRSLHAFSALRRLQVHFEFLTGPAPYTDVKLSKTLPRSLGILILSDPMVMWDGVATRGANRCLQDIVDVMEEYLEDRQDHASYLQYVNTDLSRGMPYDDTCPFSGSWDEEGNYSTEAVNLRAIALKSRVTLLVHFMRSEGGSALLHIDGPAQKARMV
ncbi:hypothetical protein BJX66DRAFT_345222 [Aspergillus keveii]|uniref:F-box domain-containing protein n=1 Tax=Aspergillus keveii TaxID=714993 RepID=A0ABR4FIQ6_9EURO